jgi:hypothetical protein
VGATVTLQALRERALRLADTSADEFRSTSDVNGLVNAHKTAVYDRLVACARDYFTQDWTITITPGTSRYQLPSPFRALSEVYELIDGRKRRLPEVQAGRLGECADPSGGTVVVEYIPNPAELVADGDTFDVAIGGADELVVALVARDLRIMQDIGAGDLDRTIAMLERRLLAAAPRRSRGVTYVVDVTAADETWVGSSLAAWRLRGGYLEVYAGATT